MPEEHHINIGTPQGDMPVFIALPEAADAGLAVIVYMDVFGPREELFDICRRFAGNGHAALLPNLFHRLGSPVFRPANEPHVFQPDPEVGSANDATTMEMTTSDTRAIVAALGDGRLGYTATGIGVIGYCMGGRHALAAATELPKAISAGLSVHGGRLVDDTPGSPHLRIRDLDCPFHFSFARDDPTCPEAHQALLERESREARAHVECERFDAPHGWSFPERWCYDEAASEAVWRRALAMFEAIAVTGKG